MISAVAGKRKIDNSVTVDPTKILVRARERGTLESLLTKFPVLLQGVTIKETAFTDYRYRLVISRDAWVEIATELAKAVSYTNYKNAVYSKHGASRFERALHRVWAEMAALQRSKPDSEDGFFDTVSTGGDK